MVHIWKKENGLIHFSLNLAACAGLGNPLENLDLVADQSNSQIIMKDGKIYENKIEFRKSLNIASNDSDLEPFIYLPLYG